MCMSLPVKFIRAAKRDDPAQDTAPGRQCGVNWLFRARIKSKAHYWCLLGGRAKTVDHGCSVSASTFGCGFAHHHRRHHLLRSDFGACAAWLARQCRMSASLLFLLLLFWLHVMAERIGSDGHG